MQGSSVSSVLSQTHLTVYDFIPLQYIMCSSTLFDICVHQSCQCRWHNETLHDVKVLRKSNRNLLLISNLRHLSLACSLSLSLALSLQKLDGSKAFSGKLVTRSFCWIGSLEMCGARLQTGGLHFSTGRIERSIARLCLGLLGIIGNSCGVNARICIHDPSSNVSQADT